MMGNESLEAEAASILIGFAGLPDFRETFEVGTAFEFVVDFVITLVAVRIAQPEVSAVIRHQPAFPEIPMCRGDGGANLYIGW